MTDERPHDRLEQAALHALGSLDGAERLEYERFIEDEGAAAQQARDELASFQRIAGQLGRAIPPMDPPPALKARILDRIRSTTQDSAPVRPGFTFIRSSEGMWVEPMPGMRLKILHVDPATQRTTAIMKFAPGFRYAPHRHAGTEELFVLEGGFECQGQELFPGDYHRSDARSMHGETRTDDGCTLLAMFSPQNEAAGSIAAHVSSTTVSLLFRLSSLITRLGMRLRRVRR